tara:strand:+ start:794 stop:979 length:186 start_codon:yes stop_codon:yes gene_type:complete
MVGTFAWTGSSGSVVFAKSGQVVGAIPAVSMDAQTEVRVEVGESYGRNEILEILLDEYSRN